MASDISMEYPRVNGISDDIANDHSIITNILVKDIPISISNGKTNDISIMTMT